MYTMKKEEALSYIRKSLILLVVSVGINGVGLALMSHRIGSLRQDVTQFQPKESSSVLSATTSTTDSTDLIQELAGVKDELARLRAEQHDINRILALPVSPRELMHIFETTTVTASTSATPTPVPTVEPTPTPAPTPLLARSIVGGIIILVNWVIVILHQVIRQL